jgi:hypothetical protein
MDAFTTYGDEFDAALTNMESALIRCKESNVTLSNEKCFMMAANDIVLGHHILAKGIQVDPEKIKVILNFPTSTLHKHVQMFIGYDSYYRRFIENFSRIAHLLFSLLRKYIEIMWT